MQTTSQTEITASSVMPSDSITAYIQHEKDRAENAKARSFTQVGNQGDPQ